ncbi:hypothetical protein L3X38_033950 [Prunus dulcis]|uniref:Reverse transcriptase zinc-binding domain-containing protein n=1 Tax=Prunus dulcis TaxID=3755 RepID=A0AAD4YWE2_PRUDU|nr:hypothetical protein L3X38_033950 [Prunus dulcis]
MLIFVKTTGSFAWKSICAARPILLQGSRWQVGSGEGIDIWKDRWVPRAITFSVITPKPTECTLSQVQELIRQNTRTWDLPFLATNIRTAAFTSSGNGFRAGWTTLWKARVQGKIKLFWWKVCRGILPTKAALSKRKIPLETSCVFCGAELETTIHILRDYPFARGV